MNLFRIIILAAAGLLVFSCAAVPVSDAASSTPGEKCTKSFLLHLYLSPAGVSEKAVQIVYGYTPLPDGPADDLKARVTGADANILAEFNLHDPRNQFGDIFEYAENSTTITGVRGIRTTEPFADLVVMFAVQPGATTFTLSDKSGRILKTVDLTKAEDRATWNCTPDYGIRPAKTGGSPVKSAPISFPFAGAAIIIVIIIIAGAGWFILKKKKT